MNCIFCKILAGEIPGEILYKDDQTAVMLDIKPINAGHVLVLPLDHHVNIYDIPEATIGAMMQIAKKMALVQKAALGTENANVYMNNGKDAGQVVFHAHIHVIPRYENDGYGLWHGKEYEPGKDKEIANKLKNALLG